MADWNSNVDPQTYLDGLQAEQVEVQRTDAKNKDRLAGIQAEIDRTQAFLAPVADIEAAAEAAVTVITPATPPPTTPAIPTPAVPPAGE